MKNLLNRIKESEIVRVTLKTSLLEKLILGYYVFCCFGGFGVPLGIWLTLLIWSWSAIYWNFKFKELRNDIREKGEQAIVQDIKDKFEATMKQMSDNIAEQHYKKYDTNG